MASKSVFITGAASGLGRALALQFSQQKFRVCVADLNEERGAETVAMIESQGGEAFYQHCDVRKFEDFEQAREAILSRWGSIDVIINNAGVASSGTFEEITIDNWEWMLSINLMGVVKGCKAFVPTFKKQGFGHIINIASMAGLILSPGMSDYNVGKAGVIALSETLYSELQPYGINTTVVCPGFFKTNLAESLRTTDDESGNTFTKLLESGELTAEDIAAMTFDAMDEKQLYLLPHQKSAEAYHLKLQDPEKHYAAMLKIANSNKRKKESA